MAELKKSSVRNSATETKRVAPKGKLRRASRTAMTQPKVDRNSARPSDDKSKDAECMKAKTPTEERNSKGTTRVPRSMKGRNSSTT